MINNEYLATKNNSSINNFDLYGGKMIHYDNMQDAGAS